MDVEVLRKELDPRTFKPFDLILVNGASFHVPYPDTLYVPPAQRGRRTSYVHLHHPEDGTGRTIDPIMITQIVHRENGQSNGHSKSGQ